MPIKFDPEKAVRDVATGFCGVIPPPPPTNTTGTIQVHSRNILV